MDDIFEVQSEIAQQVAEALKVQLLANERKEVEKKPTESTGAYTMYLKGRYYWNERTKDSLDTAIKYIKRAVELDPRYALAFSALADCYTISADWYWMNPNDAFPKAREYDHKALEIDPELAEAHASLGIIYNSYDGNWSEAEREFRRAIELKPGLAYPHMWYGIFLVVVQRFDEALEQMKVSLKLDPLSRIIRGNLGGILQYMGRVKEAIEQYELAMKEDPNFANNHAGLGWAFFLDSRAKEAVEEIRRASALSNDAPRMKSSLAQVLGLTGERDEAYKLLRELKETSTKGIVSKVHLAQILFSLGENDEAFDYLEKAYEDRSIFTNHASDLADIRYLPWFSGARSDKRWTAFEKRLGL